MSKITLSGHHWNAMGGKGFKGFMHISNFWKNDHLKGFNRNIKLKGHHIDFVSCENFQLYWTFTFCILVSTWSSISCLFEDVRNFPSQARFWKIDKSKVCWLKLLIWTDFPENLSEGPFCFKETTWTLQSATNAIYVSRHCLALFTFMNYDK